MAQKPKKTLYHSELVNLGPVEVEIKSDVLQSQYRGHNDYVIMELDGYPRNYECENDECVKSLTGLKGQVVIIEAIGSRDDAEIIVSEATNGGHGGGRDNDRRGGDRDERRSNDRDRGGDRREDTRGSSRRDDRQERRQEREPERDREPERERPAQTQTRNQRPQPTAEDIAKAEAWAIHHAKQECGRCINAMLMCMQAADMVVEERKAKGHETSADQYQAITSSFWIRMKDSNKISPLPSRLLHKEPAKPKAETQRREPAPSARTDEQRQRAAEAPQPDAPGDSHEPPPPDDDVPF